MPHSPPVALLRVVHPFPSFLVTALTLALIPFANAGSSPSRYLSLGAGMLAYQFCIGVTNDLVDAAGDRAAKPWKPIASGSITRRGAISLAIALAAAGFVATAALGAVPWLIGLGGLGCGLSYNYRLKRTPVSWLPYSIAFPLIPTWVWASTGRWEPFLLWVWPLGALLGLALHLANQAPDADADAAQGIDSLVQRIGPRRSEKIAAFLFAAAAATAAIAAAPRSLPPAAGIIAFAAAALVLRPFLARRTSSSVVFPIFALGAAMIAVLFLAAA